MLVYQNFVKRLRRTLDEALPSLLQFVEQEKLRDALKSLIEKTKKSLGSFEKMLNLKDNPHIQALIPQQLEQMSTEFKDGFAIINLSEASKLEKQLIANIYASIEVALNLSSESSVEDMRHEVKEKLFDSILEDIGIALKQQTNIEKIPSCFISYAWGDTVIEDKVHALAHRLSIAGVKVILDIVHNRTGSIIKFIGGVYQEKFVLVIGSQLLKKKYDAPGEHGSYVYEELQNIGVRLKERPQQHGIIKVLLENPAWSAFPDFLKPYPHDETDFTNHLDYFEKFFNLLSLLYADDPKALACLVKANHNFIQQSDLIGTLTLEKLQPYLKQEDRKSVV